ncbi:hypothetical protein [Crocosphaera subtropica]|uniref:hypothetical protein n=1 Tax=Crocosphaera subtropica TaxID=2546360 RepID=UPI0002313516|nr:hypothetical protein [Crocosphaera subtropica]
MSQDRICGHNECLKNGDDVIAFSADSICKLAILKQKIETFLSSEVSNQLVDFLGKAGMKYLQIFLVLKVLLSSI